MIRPILANRPYDKTCLEASLIIRPILIVHISWPLPVTYIALGPFINDKRHLYISLSHCQLHIAHLSLGDCHCQAPTAYAI